MENQTITMTQATKVCPYCGAIVSQNAQKCQKCGEWIVGRYGKSWVKSMLLCSFLGGFGAHNFYNGKTGIGIAQLLTFFGFCGIWPFVDFIMILCNGYTDSNGLKLSKKPTKQSTAVLCFFLGLGGAHRFYTGHVALGFLQAFTGGGCFIWTLIDFIMILTGNFKDAEGNYIK
jgi:TM2 domain-containing membrane protein YozV